MALHLFRASKYIGKIRLSNSIQNFFQKYEIWYCYIMIKVSNKYCLLEKNGAAKKVYKSTVACVDTDKELTELLFQIFFKQEHV